METDHLLLKPPPNTATPTSPVAFGFYYMTYKYDPPKLRPVVKRWFDPDNVDPVGPSPLIIHKAQLASLLDPFWQLSLELKRDKEANVAFGWVLEMWAWALAAARAGVKHQVRPSRDRMLRILLSIAEALRSRANELVAVLRLV